MFFHFFSSDSGYFCLVLDTFQKHRVAGAWLKMGNAAVIEGHVWLHGRDVQDDVVPGEEWALCI